MSKMRKKVVYYNEKGKIDKFSTYINNHDWTFIVTIILALLVAGFVY